MKLTACWCNSSSEATVWSSFLPSRPSSATSRLKGGCQTSDCGQLYRWSVYCGRRWTHDPPLPCRSPVPVCVKMTTLSSQNKWDLMAGRVLFRLSSPELAALREAEQLLFRLLCAVKHHLCLKTRSPVKWSKLSNKIHFNWSYITEQIQSDLHVDTSSKDLHSEGSHDFVNRAELISHNYLTKFKVYLIDQKKMPTFADFTSRGRFASLRSLNIQYFFYEINKT